MWPSLKAVRRPCLQRQTFVDVQLKAAETYLARVLYLTWRDNLCSEVHRRYFFNLNFYKLNVLDKTLDNLYVVVFLNLFMVRFLVKHRTVCNFLLCFC